MSGVSRGMTKSLMCTTKCALRFCRSSGEVAAGSRRGMGSTPPSMPTVRSAPSSNSCSAKSILETRRPASFFFSLPGEMACALSLMPLHSATATTRMVAQLSTTADTLLQGVPGFIHQASLALRRLTPTSVKKLLAQAGQK